MQAQRTFESDNQDFLLAANICGSMFENTQDVTRVMDFVNAPLKTTQDEVKTVQPSLPVVDVIISTVKNAMAVPRSVLGKVRTIVANKNEPLPS